MTKPLTPKAAYAAGWRASLAPTADLDRAESRFARRHGLDYFDPLMDDWLDGWMDVAVGRDKWALYRHRHEGAPDPREEA